MAVMQHKWTREDTILVLDYYFTMRKGKDQAGNPDIIHLARLIGITPASVVLKLLNCRGLYPRREFPPCNTQFSKMHKNIYEEFKNNRSALRAEAERIKTSRAAKLPASQTELFKPRQQTAAIPAFLFSPDGI